MNWALAANDEAMLNAGRLRNIGELQQRQRQRERRKKKQ